MDSNPGFTFRSETHVNRGCPAMLNGDMYVFGGRSGGGQFGGPTSPQISKINGCSLDRVDDLPRDFDNGACGTYLFPEERVMLCFSWRAGSSEDNYSQCMSYDGSNVDTSFPLSHYEHVSDIV